MTDLALTNSSAQTWRACRRKYLYAYERNLKPIGQKAYALRFGTLVHSGLDVWHTTRDSAQVERHLQSQVTTQSDEALTAYHVARLMLEGYAAMWDDSDIAAMQTERTFTTPLINPATGRASRSFSFRGKVDGVPIYDDGTVRLMEHKTAAAIDGTYLERLWSDAQITGYVAALRAENEPIREVIYNIIRKPSIRRGEEETLDHYVRRLQELYVGGYSAGRCKRRKAETDDEWWARRRAEGEPVDMYHRGVVLIGDHQLREWQADLWDVGQEILWARQHDRWPRSTARCYDWNRPCDYAPICQSLGSEETIIECDYAVDVAHPELDGEEETPF